MKKEYTGSAYIGVVGSEIEYGICRDSISLLRIRQGDSQPVYARYTKGYESRQMHFNNWLDETRHDFMLLLDQDQEQDPLALEKLREHKLPFVSGLYLRRQTDPIAPIWFEPYAGKVPLKPFIRKIESGKLYKIGASGWGTILIHREVALAVRELLKGEWDVFESPMDVYPYDLVEIMRALKALRRLTQENVSKSTIIPTLAAHLSVLEREIVPLRWDKSAPIGSDIRYAIYAKIAGYQLYGDPDVRAGHVVNFSLHPDNYDQMDDDYYPKLRKSSNDFVRELYKAQDEIARRADEE